VTHSADMAEINFVAWYHWQLYDTFCASRPTKRNRYRGQLSDERSSDFGFRTEVSVKLCVPQGTSIRDAISKLIQKGKTSAQFDFLVLFSLDPVALHDAATQKYR